MCCVAYASYPHVCPWMTRSHSIPESAPPDVVVRGVVVREFVLGVVRGVVRGVVIVDELGAVVVAVVVVSDVAFEMDEKEPDVNAEGGDVEELGWAAGNSAISALIRWKSALRASTFLSCAVAKRKRNVSV